MCTAGPIKALGAVGAWNLEGARELNREEPSPRKLESARRAADQDQVF